MDPDNAVDDISTTSDFDDRGVPLTLQAAQLMSEDELVQAVTDVIAELEATSFEDVKSWEKADDGTVSLDSHLAVDVFNEFTAHLSAFSIDLANVAQEKWTSIGGVVQVIMEAYRSLEPGAVR
ncbi:hypothetical protein [Arthrobacter sp. Z4-13]